MVFISCFMGQSRSHALFAQIIGADNSADRIYRKHLLLEGQSGNLYEARRELWSMLPPKYLFQLIFWPVNHIHAASGSMPPGLSIFP